MLFSIIIPAFNVESYLPKAVDSALAQTYSGKFEIILIDDGSTDATPKICDDYAKNYSQISVVHKSNGGQSSARNLALKQAQGKYIVFLDSDDWLENDALSTFAQSLQEHEVDFLGFSYRGLYSDGSILEIKKLPCPPGFVQDMGKHLKSYDLLTAVWSYVYKKEFLDKNKIYFVEGIIHEDDEFTYHAACFAQNASYIEYHGYNYLQRENSTVTKKDLPHLEKLCRDLSTVIDKLVELLKKFSETTGQYECLVRQINRIEFLWFQGILASPFPRAFVKAQLQHARVRWAEQKLPEPRKKSHLLQRKLVSLHCPLWLLRGIQKKLNNYLIHVFSQNQK
jgi:glycosyltransferase involved in cell wall biosynthesis